MAPELPDNFWFFGDWDGRGTHQIQGGIRVDVLADAPADFSGHRLAGIPLQNSTAAKNGYGLKNK